MLKKWSSAAWPRTSSRGGGSESELESINGYFLKMADDNGVKVPYNRTIYEMYKKEFNKPSFQPLDVKDVWREVEKVL